MATGPDCAKLLFPLRVCGLHDKTWIFLATCQIVLPLHGLVGVRRRGKSLGISFLALLCKVSERIRNIREIYTDLRHTRCRYEEVVCADSLPETVRLIVEQLYVISMRGTYLKK
jgi:hypothetical protein